MRILLNILFWLGLTIWIAMVTAPGLTGMSAFPVLIEEGARIDRYSAFFENDQEGMGRIVAGFVAGRVFLITDLAQWVLAPLVTFLGLLLIRPVRLYGGPFAWAGSTLLVVALALTVWHNGVMAPRMAEEIQNYRTAVEANDREAANAAMTSFEVDHKTAERLFGLRWCLLLGTVAGFAGGQRRRPEESVERP
ncbi:MAG: hypothetical protein CMJ33_01890 [Phycisphaerae bacterium]|nr:hypothetical protein [Phycisphaerae bacterium]HAW95424.1 hypothetical protein [Phycisphaerales bacterium]